MDDGILQQSMKFFDFCSYLEMEEMAYVMNALHPVATYLFSNSPFQNGKRLGQKKY